MSASPQLFFHALLFILQRLHVVSCAALSLLVLHAMRDDSEKVPALLTDYILKGKRTVILSHFQLLPRAFDISEWDEKQSKISHVKWVYCINVLKKKKGYTAT